MKEQGRIYLLFAVAFASFIAVFFGVSFFTGNGGPQGIEEWAIFLGISVAGGIIAALILGTLLTFRARNRKKDQDQ